MRFQQAILLMLGTIARGLNIPSRRDAIPETSYTYEPIKSGFVSFGDSYAAGIGTGKTSPDGCRLGEFSYPNLLETWVKSLQPGIDYQNLPCSGATISELLQGGDSSQIDKWTNPSKADRATISIGGNDVGFSKILNGCVLDYTRVLTPKCDVAISDAYSTMNSADFSNNLASVLRQILAKSGRDDFKIIQTGYPTFFNDQTDSCDYTTFYFYQPGHHGFHRGAGWMYLYKDLRTKLNKLVTDLNSQIKAVIDDVNQDFPAPRVLFADPNPYFDGHRFCEEGITEPDSQNMDNWFFLSAWDDNSLPGTNSETLSGLSEIVQEAKYASENLTVPDAATCASSNDWADQTICGMVKGGVIVPSADGVGWEYAKTIELPDGTEISPSDIPWLYPTRYVKTFHPRSLGQLAFRELVRKTW